MQLQKKMQPRGARHRQGVSETLSDGSHDTHRFAQPLLVLPPRGSQPHEMSSRRSDRDESSGGVQHGATRVSSRPRRARPSSAPQREPARSGARHAAAG